MNYGIILAAGSGKRMGDGPPKALRIIAGNTALWHVINIFDKAQEVDAIVLVVPKDQVVEYTDIITAYDFKKSLDIVEGGASRMESSYKGLKAVSTKCDIVAVHDAARITISSETIDEAIRYAKKHGSALVAGPVFDTIKQVKDGKVEKTIDRGKLKAAFTPQIFRYKELMTAFLDAKSEGIEYTDESLVMENAGYKVYVFDTGKREIKLTIEDDIYLVEALLNKGIPKVGIGIDTHKLVVGRKLILGGVEIPFKKGLLGHSDADVLIHAIMDALLGGAGLNDIGYHFPDTDKKYEGASSIELLKYVAKMIEKVRINVVNIDVSVVCQEPKLSPYRDQMIINIADALGIDERIINIKATTTEGIGEHGQGKAISAIVVCSLIERKAD